MLAHFPWRHDPAHIVAFDLERMICTAIGCDEFRLERAIAELGNSKQVEQLPTAAEDLVRSRELSRDEHVSWVPGLTEAFAAEDYDYTALVRAMAESETYRQVR